MLIENGKINYNGLKANLVTWAQLEHFSPPRTMLCAVDHLDYAQALLVYAYDPDKDYPVITEKGSFKYCADVPVWDFEAACAYLSRAIPGLSERKGDFLYYKGNGADELGGPIRRILANKACVYYSFGNDNPTTYDAVTVDGLDRMARMLKEYHEKMSSHATDIELAEWCSTGHGMWRHEGEDQCHTRFDPILGEMNKPIPLDIRIWPWDMGHWVEPTRENMGIIKKKD